MNMEVEILMEYHMETHDLFPFTFEEWEDPGVVERMMFLNVTFTEAFGAFELGEHVETLSVNYDMATLEVFDTDGNVTKSVKFRAVPVEQEAPVEIGGSD